MDSMVSTFFLFHLEWPFSETQKGTAQWSPSEEGALPYLAGFFSLARRLFSPPSLWKSWSSSSGPKRNFWQPLILQRGRNLQDKKNSIIQRSYVSWAYYFNLSYRILQTFIRLLIIFTSVVSQGWNDIDSDRQAKKALEEYKKLYRSVSLKSPEQHFYNEIDIDFPLFCFQFPQWGFVHDQSTVERACESLHVLAKSWC